MPSAKSTIVAIFLGLGLSGVLLSRIPPIAATPPEDKPIVLAELFTSEGCSSCPPADRLLGKLVSRFQEVEVVPLAFHVDYWNYLGWRDRFSSAEYSARQRRYAISLPGGQVYTPQLVVDGATGLVGSDEAGARRAILAAARRPKIRPAISAVAQEGEVRLKLKIPREARLGNGAQLFLAVTEDGLHSEVTRGENVGRRLEHTAVVRHLVALGTIPRNDDGFQKTITVKLDSAWRVERLHAVVWIQEKRHGKVLGAARTSLAIAS